MNDEVDRAVKHITSLPSYKKATEGSESELSDLLSVESKRERMRNMVKSLAEYMATYDQQAGYENYTETIFVDDVLYGLGIALQPEKYRYAGGYDEFKKFLKDHLDR